MKSIDSLLLLFSDYNPTEKALAIEIIEQLKPYEHAPSSTTPTSTGLNDLRIRISLSRKYSHHIVKKVVNKIGFKTCTQKPEGTFDIAERCPKAKRVKKAKKAKNK